ncbi:MAG TPA: HNH endonuclease signature motif containing protein [Nocardioidaceae bacterium]|nr:HNH endonuclease signature motif containing protein [Nocardioidaceae bacterium]
MTALLLALSLATAHPPCWADGHNHHRSRAVVRQFKRSHPCPGGPDAGSRSRCRGYQVDHVCPLACCGHDAVSNLQWLSAAENQAKGADCSACGRKR